MSRLHITHRTSYAYNGTATTSYNEARMTPATDAQQITLESSIAITPRQAVATTYRDYWGTRVTPFDVHVPHEALEVLATATVEVHRSEPRLAEDELVDWARMESMDTVHEFSDFLPQTRLSEPGDAARERARGLRAARPHETARNVLEWLDDAMSYQPGVTAVTSGAEEALATGQGVCQDLAHIGIGMMRALGIPARYVSGYIHPRPSAGLGTAVAGQSHAWLEWWDGHWVGWDVTGGEVPGERHIVASRGRDFDDNPNLRGIYATSGEVETTVEVDITRLA